MSPAIPQVILHAAEFDVLQRRGIISWSAFNVVFGDGARLVAVSHQNHTQTIPVVVNSAAPMNGIFTCRLKKES